VRGSKIVICWWPGHRRCRDLHLHAAPLKQGWAQSPNTPGMTCVPVRAVGLSMAAVTNHHNPLPRATWVHHLRSWMLKVQNKSQEAKPKVGQCHTPRTSQGRSVLPPPTPQLTAPPTKCTVPASASTVTSTSPTWTFHLPLIRTLWLTLAHPALPDPTPRPLI
jgi:hypothetical protein